MGLRALAVGVRASQIADPPGAPPPRLKGDGENRSTYQKDVLPFLKAHCFNCHGNGKAKADLSFDKYTDDKSVLADRKVWDNIQHIASKCRENAPSATTSQPKPTDVDAAVSKAIKGIASTATTPFG